MTPAEARRRYGPATAEILADIQREAAARYTDEQARKAYIAGLLTAVIGNMELDRYTPQDVIARKRRREARAS